VAVERKHSGGAQVVRNGPSSPLCSDPPVSVLLFFSKVSPPCFVLLASVFLFLHSARSPLSNRPLSFLFSVSFNSQNLLVVSFSLSPVFLFFSPSLVSLPLFISRKRGSSPLLCPIVVQGGTGLPYLCRVR